MKAFIQDAPKQTHTADDDCEKLAAVFIPAMQKFHEIYEKTYEFVRMMDSKKIIATYRIIKNSPVIDGIKKKTLKTRAGTPSGPVGFEKTAGIGQIRKKIVNKFLEDLSFDFLAKNNIDKKEAQKQIDDFLKEKQQMKGSVQTIEKIKKYNEFMDYTEQQVIEWYTKNILTPKLNEATKIIKILKVKVK